MQTQKKEVEKEDPNKNGTTASKIRLASALFTGQLRRPQRIAVTTLARVKTYWEYPRFNLLAKISHLLNPQNFSLVPRYPTILLTSHSFLFNISQITITQKFIFISG